MEQEKRFLYVMEQLHQQAMLSTIPGCDDSNIMLWQSGLLYVDSDGDGYDNGSATVCYGASIPEGYVTSTLGSDCNDADTAIHEAVLCCCRCRW